MVWRKRIAILLALGVLGTVLLFFLTLLMVGPHVRVPYGVSHETTYLTEPVDEQGYLRVAEALDRVRSQGVDRENNAAIPLLEALGGRRPSSRLYPLRKALGLEVDEGAAADAEVSRGDDDASITAEEKADSQGGEASEVQGETTLFKPAETGFQSNQEGTAVDAAQFERAQQGPFQRVECPEVVAWIEGNQESLARISAAAGRSYFYVPTVTSGDGLVSTNLEHLEALRMISSCLIARAHLALAEGRVEEAWEDVRTIGLWARHCLRGVYLMERLVGLALAGQATKLAWRVLEHTPTDADLDAQLALELKSFLLIETSSASLVGERMLMVDSVDRLARGEFGRALEPNGTRSTDLTSHMGPWGIDFAVVQKNLQSRFDEIETLWRIEPHPVRRDRLKAYFHEFEAEAERLRNRMSGIGGIAARLMPFGKAQRSRDLSTIMAMLLLPPMRLVADAEAAADNDRDLVSVAWALARFRKQRGYDPQALQELLEIDPQLSLMDRLSGAAFILQSDESRITVYHVGRDGVDQGGPPPEAGVGGDDRGFSWARLAAPE